MIETHVGVLDVVGQSAQRNTVLVLPTLPHAIALWKSYRRAVSEAHGAPNVKHTKTAVYMYSTRTTLRLWVPYFRDPTQPMDLWHWRRGFHLMTPYDKRVVP